MRTRERNEKIIELARELYYEEGAIEIDAVTDKTPDQVLESMISEGADNGAYVQAWVWVDFDGTTLNKEA